MKERPPRPRIPPHGRLLPRACLLSSVVAAWAFALNQVATHISTLVQVLLVGLDAKLVAPLIRGVLSLRRPRVGLHHAQQRHELSPRARAPNRVAAVVDVVRRELVQATRGLRSILQIRKNPIII
eukprot:1804443-Pyramimonas_sp.AAC.1